MRSRLSILLLAVVVGLAAAASASAGPKILVTTKTYPVAGDDGAALVKAMDRTGPRQGFMTRAIAQTSYTVDWDLQVARTKDACRLARAEPTLHVNYIFPRADNLPPALAKRWKRFMAGVRKHEKTHGRIAAEMVRAAARSVSGLTYAQDPACDRTRREAWRRIDAIYAKYEARQVAFDGREHAAGGQVEKLVDTLTAGD